MSRFKNKQLQLSSELLSCLHTQIKDFILANLVGAIVVLLGFWNKVDNTLLVAWFALLLSFQIILFYFEYYLYLKQNDLILKQTWLKYYYSMFILIGLLWAGCSLFLHAFDDVFYRMFLLFVIMSVVTSSVISLSSVKFAFNTILFIIMTPVVVQFIYIGYKAGNTLELDIGVLLLIYAIIMRDAALKSHKVFHDSLEARMQLTDMANNDSLTEIANRRKFDQTFIHEWQRSYRSRRPISLILVDVDYFKAYNDHYGHQAGDEALKQVAKALKGAVRRSVDLVARYGGEEFVIVLPETPIEGALKVAENMRRAVVDLAQKHEFSDASNVLTITLGVASTVPEDKHEGKGLIDATDHALYLAKENGRNQIMCADEV